MGTSAPAVLTYRSRFGGGTAHGLQQQGYSRFYYSKDRAKTWQGPYKLPTYDRKGIAARTDYIVDGKHELTAFITASKENGREGRVVCIRTRDGGRTWDLESFIGPEPEGFSIMPSSVRLSPTRIHNNPAEGRTGALHRCVGHER